MPKIAFPSVPFLGVQGFMVTKYAATHGVESLAQDFVANYISTPAAQAAARERERPLARRTRRPASAFTDPVLAQFGKAGKGGVPMPNIPQMGSVWTDLGQAWVRSTKGAGATPAAALVQRRQHARSPTRSAKRRDDTRRAPRGAPALPSDSATVPT